jgi:hypothetical protein
MLSRPNSRLKHVNAIALENNPTHHAPSGDLLTGKA